MGQELPPIKRILELNPEHAAGHRPARRRTRRARRTRAWPRRRELLYGMALLAEGGELADPARFIKLLASRLEKTL